MVDFRGLRPFSSETSLGSVVRSRDASVRCWDNRPHLKNPLLLVDGPDAFPDHFVGFTEETRKTCFYARDVYWLSGYNTLSSAVVTDNASTDSNIVFA